MASPSSSSSGSASSSLLISNEPSLAQRNLVVINVAMQAPLKLTETTYFPWRKQFDVLLIGYDLCGFVDGTLPCPSPVLSDNKTSNPDYIFWVRQDSLLLGAILASLSKEVHHIVTSADTSRAAWHKLALTFAKPSRPRLLRLRERLRMIHLSSIGRCGEGAIVTRLEEGKGSACGYYLHRECVELKDLPQKRHPLHPQHPLAEHLNYHCEKSFVCSFCGETKKSRRFYQCSVDQCDFYLDTACEIDFIKRPELLDKYEIQHVLHNHENHRLSPTIQQRAKCAGCTYSISKGSAFYKCIACSFYLHTECSQVPKEAVHHHSHPQHPLVLLQNPPPKEVVRCAACLDWIKRGFYLHCNHCPTFNLDLDCYVRFKPTLKHEAHEHPLAYFAKKIFDALDDVRCYACNTPCKYGSFRCFACNFNIHYGCHALPITVNYYDHLHPLTLTTSFGDDEDPSTYYCDICEKPRDPDHGIYLCKECPFMAHFECALSLSTEEEAEYADAPWRQKLKDEEEDMRLSSNEKVCVLEILDQLNEEIKKVREVIQQLSNKKEKGEELTEKLQEFEERHANTEDMLRRLKQSVRETNSN